jgi:alpha-D-ribose 1-methylphosphonate 5-triphosphate synthase subunit PhnG
MHLSRSSLQQRSNDLLALARARGVRTLNVGVSTIARNIGVSTIELNVGAPTAALASYKLCST